MLSVGQNGGDDLLSRSPRARHQLLGSKDGFVYYGAVLVSSGGVTGCCFPFGLNHNEFAPVRSMTSVGCGLQYSNYYCQDFFLFQSYFFIFIYC
jgi:hypothetical protein